MSIIERAPISEQDSTSSPTVTLAFFHSPTSGRSRRAEGFLAQVLQRRGNHHTFKLLRVTSTSAPTSPAASASPRSQPCS